MLFYFFYLREVSFLKAQLRGLLSWSHHWSLGIYNKCSHSPLYVAPFSCANTYLLYKAFWRQGWPVIIITLMSSTGLHRAEDSTVHAKFNYVEGMLWSQRIHVERTTKHFSTIMKYLTQAMHKENEVYLAHRFSISKLKMKWPHC